MEKTREEMTQWVQKVAKAQEINCEVEHEENRDILRMGFRLNCAIPYVNIVIVAEESCFISYGFIDNNAGKRLAEVSEFLMRANNIDDIGHFSLDYDEGQICYKLYASYRIFDKDDDLFLLFHFPVIRFTDYGDGLLKVILGCATPKEAFEDSINNKVAQKNEDDSENADGVNSQDNQI